MILDAPTPPEPLDENELKSETTLMCPLDLRGGRLGGKCIICGGKWMWG